jgi:hypothetical protein
MPLVWVLAIIVAVNRKGLKILRRTSWFVFLVSMNMDGVSALQGEPLHEPNSFYPPLNRTVIDN